MQCFFLLPYKVQLSVFHVNMCSDVCLSVCITLQRWLSVTKCTISLLVSDNFPQMAHQKRFIERKYRQELKEMRWEREHQEKEPDETEDIKK